jgi:hypothetical protein
VRRARRHGRLARPALRPVGTASASPSCGSTRRRDRALPARHHRRHGWRRRVHRARPGPTGRLVHGSASGARPATPGQHIASAVPATRTVELAIATRPTTGHDVAGAVPATGLARRHLTTVPATPRQHVPGPMPAATRRRYVPGAVPTARPIELRIATVPATTRQNVTGPVPTTRRHLATAPSTPSQEVAGAMSTARRHISVLPATTCRDVTGAMPATRTVELPIATRPITAGHDITRAMPATRRHIPARPTPTGQHITSAVPATRTVWRPVTAMPATRPSLRHVTTVPATRPSLWRVAAVPAATGQHIAGPMPATRTVAATRTTSHDVAGAVPAWPCQRPLTAARAAAVPGTGGTAATRVLRGLATARPGGVLLAGGRFGATARSTEPASRTGALTSDRAFGSRARPRAGRTSARRHRRRKVGGIARQRHLGCVAGLRNHRLGRCARRADRASRRRNRTARLRAPALHRLGRQPANPGERPLRARPRRRLRVPVAGLAGAGMPRQGRLSGARAGRAGNGSTGRTRWVTGTRETARRSGSPGRQWRRRGGGRRARLGHRRAGVGTG